jgi:hypothetical protein
MTNTIKNNPITAKELKAVKQELLEKLATKEEISKLATKEEISKLATKEEMNKHATKDELRLVEIRLEKLEKSVDLLAAQVTRNSDDIQRLTVEVVDMRQEMALLETKADADRKFNLIMQAINGLAAKIDAMHTEKAAFDHGLNRHETILSDHEKRTSTLEVQEQT